MLINLSLQILRDAAWRARAPDVNTLPARLALRVLMPFVKDRRPLNDFWRELTMGDGHPWSSCHPAYSRIKASLEAAGWHAAEEDHPPPAPDVCAELGLSLNIVALLERFAIRNLAEIPRAPPALVKPGYNCWAITWGHGSLRMDVARWGLRRSTPATDGRRASEYVSNIRDPDRAFWSKGSVDKGTLPGERCIIPVTEFGYRAAGSTAGAATEWFAIPSEPIFAIAGMWIGHPHHAVALHVSEANPLVAPLSPAMPLILHREDELRWLEHGELAELVVPFPSQLMVKLHAS